MIVYAVVDDSLSRYLLGDSIDVFVRRKDAEEIAVILQPQCGTPTIARDGQRWSRPS